jgi:hypothetical protein
MKEMFNLIIYFMKKIILVYVLSFLATTYMYSQDQPKNIIGVSAGIVPGIMDLYFDMPFNFWPKRELSPIYQLFYARQVREAFRIGGYLEYEKAKFSGDSDGLIHSFRRTNVGLNWLGQFPKTAFHLQLGGYFGYGFVKADNWTDLKGIDLGLIMGPAYEKKNMGVAVHMHGGHAWYNSTGIPTGVMLYTPKVLFKIYRKF